MGNKRSVAINNISIIKIKEVHVPKIRIWEIQNRRRFDPQPINIIRREDVPADRIVQRICNCQNCQRRRRLEMQDIEDEEDLQRLQMAIQMSLDSTRDINTDRSTRLTDDVEEYNISNMFQEPDENTLIRQRQDEEYARAEEIDLARQRLAEDVDTEAVREARLARFNQ